MSPEMLSNHMDDTLTCLERDKMEPIAIIGLSLRFPQDATTPQTFWNMLMEKRSAMTEVPGERFNVHGFYEEGEHRTGVLGVKGGHFMKENIAGFDAPFFSITPGEAECMDPQQRWLLEVAYEVFENAGISMEQASGSKTSVHVGCFMRDYEHMLMTDPEMHRVYQTTGVSSAMLANRLSWFYNLKGPSLSLDTACSSSLTALHLACQSMRCGESTMGLVGGCNLFFNPDIMTSMTDLGFLSPDSRSYCFDHRANGYSRGEAFGMVLIKPLSSAIEDGDTIRAVIRATSANQDGRTPGITQPSTKAQEDMIREAYMRGGLDLAQTRFFEAHGTGTAIGDPIEAEAIHKVFGAQRVKEQPLYIGAVKSNIGHTEGASGLAGLIKTVLILEKAIIPPNALLERVNPKIPSLDWCIQFPLHPIPWPSQYLRRASVSAFGFGGANAHAVLDDAFNYLRLRNLKGSHNTREIPPRPMELEAPRFSMPKPSRNGSLDQDDTKVTSQPILLIWSAFDDAALKHMLSRFRQYIKDNVQGPEQIGFLEQLALTLSSRRSRLPCRTYVVARSVHELEAHLDTSSVQPTRVAKDLKLGFVFTGQGAQWPSMGAELLSFPVYKQSLELAGLHLHSLGCEWDIIDEISSPQSSPNLNHPTYSQPICTALQIALVDLLASWGVSPTTVIGHSSGEIAAAYSAGAISRESAWELAYHRGIVATLSKTFSKAPLAMMAVGLSETDFQAYWDRTLSVGGEVAIACFNSPHSITISGCEERINAIKQSLDDSGVFARKLKVDVAYHTAYMETVSPVYRDLIGSIVEPKSESMKSTMFSSVTGMRVSSTELLQSSYWVENMTSPVRFRQAVETAFVTSPSKQIKDAVEYLLEIGPHSTLQGPLKEILRTSEWTGSVQYNSVLVRDKSASETILQSMGNLYCKGFPVDISLVNRYSATSASRGPLVDLPSYPWNHDKKYWLESRISRNYRLRNFPRHELLGTPVSDWNPLEARWRHTIRLSEKPWIKDHRVDGANVYPAAGILVMVIEALRQMSDPNWRQASFHFRDVTVQKALVVPSTGGIEAQLTLRPCRGSKRESLRWNDFRLCVNEKEDWTELCSGEAAIEYVKDPDDTERVTEEDYASRALSQEYKAHIDVCKKTVKAKDIYEHFAKLGISYGPPFATLKDIRYNKDGETTASVNLHDWQKEFATGPRYQGHVIHPAALDAIFQSVFAALTQGGTKSFPTLVPTKFRNLWIAANLHELDDAEANIFTRANFVGSRNAESSIRAISTTTGRPFVVGGYEMAFVSGHERSLRSDGRPNLLCYYMDWKPDFALMDYNHIKSYCYSGNDSDSLHSRLKQEEKRLACYIAMRHSLDYLPPQEVWIAKPHLKRYSDWMKHQISINSTQNNFSMPEKQWKACAADPDHFRQLLDKVQGYDAEGGVISLVATNLPGVLSGEIDGLSLLFGENSLMEQYYSYSHSSASAFSKVARYVDLLAHKNSDIRVLEIGAGTGGATEIILRALMRQSHECGGSPRFAEYVYTDISPSFFEKARTKFNSTIGRMTFATLNIEQDPLEQGFEEAGYDLVIASYVLHATRMMDTTLRNTRKLLKGGGKLIAYETLSPDAILPAFIFGVLPGWWLGEEENRKWGPLLNEADWSICLSEAGFSGVDFSLDNHRDASQQSGSAIVSTAIGTRNNILPSLNVVIVRARSSGFEDEIISKLSAKLKTLSSAGSQVCDVIDCQSMDLSQSVCIFLHELQQPLLYNITEAAYHALQKLISTCHALLWITSEPTENPVNQLVQGFARCVREESKSLRFVTASLDTSRGAASMADKILLIYNSTILDPSEDFEREFVEKDDRLLINRVVEADDMNLHVHSKTTIQAPKLNALSQYPMRPLKLNFAVPGMLDSLEFQDDLRACLPLLDDEIEIEIKACGLNFRDVLIALGQLAADDLQGECAGIVKRAGSSARFHLGDRVVGFTEVSFATVGRAKSSQVCKIPKDVSFAAAAAVPTIYCTAHYSLSHWARIKPGETILIHSAAGGFGQAVIQLAKIYGAEIYVTVGSEEKRQFLFNTYNIPKDHMFSSRSNSFAKGVKRMTNNRGVDVVINSLTGEALRSSWECVAPYGRFIEVGKKDIYNYGTLPMYQFAKNVTFACVDLVHLLQEKAELASTLLNEVIEMLRLGKIATPKPLHVYKTSHVEEAFRYMQSGKNIGKIVVEFSADDVVPIVPSMLPTWDFKPEATYLVAGGFGGLGRCTARWMASRNAKNLILLGRQGAHSIVAKQLLEDLMLQGVTVAAPKCDVTDRTALADVLAECDRTMPPIKGCIVGTMVLKDSAFETMAYSDFQIPINPKVTGTHNLHTLLPRDLDFFICLSSMSGIVGIPGQSNYGAGNAYQDALMHHRIAAGQKAISLNLGLVLSIGYIAEHERIKTLLHGKGYLPVREEEYLALLDYSCDPRLPVLPPLQCQVVTGPQIPAELHASGIPEAFYMRLPLFRHLRQIRSDNYLASSLNPKALSSQCANAAPSLQQNLTAATSWAEAEALTLEEMVAKVSKSLDVDKEQIDTGKPLHNYGVDSLSAVELRSWLRRDVGAEMTVFDILGNSSIAELAQSAARQSRFVSGSLKENHIEETRD